VLEEAAKKVGLSARISAELGALKRDFWDMGNESSQNFGQRLARELGGVFKISGGKASLTSATEYTNAEGVKLDAIIAEWGRNLVAWRIKPYAGRPQFK
jgi:phage protein D